jgi:two-component system sensor kinase FixL
VKRPKPRSDAGRTLGLQQARWQAVLDTVQDAVIGIDVEGSITLFNRAAEAMFGYQPEDVLGRNVSMLMPEPYRHEHDGYLSEYRRTGVPKAIGRIRNVHALRRSGEVFPIELSVSEARFEDEVVYTAIIRDVSERERVAAALRTSEARSRGIIDNAVEGIVTIDEHGIINSFNPAAVSMFGYAAGEVIGQNVNILMPEPYRREHDGYIATYLRTGEGKIIGIGREAVAQRKDGTIFPIHLAVSEIPLGNKRLFTGIIHDISERRRAEATLREMEKAALERQRLADIGAITAQIVHDLGNPLAAISMQGQWILRRARRDPAQPIGAIANAADQIVSRVKYLDGMIREFLEFTREQRLNLTVVDLTRFLRDVAEFWRPLAIEHRIGIKLEAPKDIPPVRADEEKLRRVFDNLIKNAIEAIAGGPGTLTLRVARAQRGTVRISVIDDGPGLPKDLDIFRLFETTKPFGTGLGLPIVRQILLAHGGGIEVAQAVPHGAAFHVDLPSGELAG